MSYSNKTKERLKNYKTKKFPNLSDGIWKNNKQPYPYILPEENKFENILKIYRSDTIEYIDKCKIKLHPNFHHLNSSQAMCLNFFFPLLQERKLEVITELLGFTNETVNYNKVCFEKNGIEANYGRRPTSFDFYFETISGKELYFEIKYTEKRFGESNNNPDKFDAVYSKLLGAISPQFHNSTKFYKNYQILRNLIHINGNSYVIFIYPKDNKKVKEEAERVEKDFLLPIFHNHFFSVTWENCFDNISNLVLNNSIKAQLAEFKEKYIPD